MIQHRIKEREPQYMDMKEIIAEAARKLILEKKVKKLTVKDIVEECQITRQAFYYHFEGIPDNKEFLHLGLKNCEVKKYTMN